MFLSIVEEKGEKIYIRWNKQRKEWKIGEGKLCLLSSYYAAVICKGIILVVLSIPPYKTQS